jgi:YVTN family beta-propeller protein
MTTAPRILQITSIVMAALLINACGGGQTSEETHQNTPVAQATPRETRSQLFTLPEPMPADVHIKGLFSPVVSWPLIPIHVSMLADGRLLSFGTDGDGKQTGSFIYDVWDPQGGLSGGHMVLANSTGTDLFCSSLVLLSSGAGVFIAGGDNWSGTGTTNTANNNANFFDAQSNTLTRGINMNRPRWYSSSTTLLNGEVYIQGGAGGTDFAEVRGTDGSFRLLSTAPTDTLQSPFPRNFVAPNGHIFGFDAAGRMYEVDASGTGSITLLGSLDAANTGTDSSAAMFRPGRILQMGGSSNGAVVIDIRSGSPVVSSTQNMNKHRRLGTATVLANGAVLSTGGSRVWNVPDADMANSAEIWNPDTGVWTPGAEAVKARMYHSTAILLPDASVLVAGGGSPGPQINLNAELYLPPYLFNSSGKLAERPVITQAPTVMDVGKTYRVQTQTPSTRPTTRVVLVRTGSVTHGWNMDQRFLELAFNTGGNGAVMIQAPSHAADSPPGMYMLFVLDSQGVPSVAKLVRINVAENLNPETVPTLAAPADQSSITGADVRLQLSATDPNSDALLYSATGLPLGVTLNTQTGLITGAPNTAGSFNVVVSASDGVNTDSHNLVWRVASVNGPLQLSMAAPQPAISGTSSRFTAGSSNGIDTRYRWNFGDGSPSTDWSASPTTNHAFTHAGLYVVSVTAIDTRGVQSVSSTQHTVYLPATSGTPKASTQLLWQAPASGNARLWVVNQDANSVTVLDAITRAKLKEINVGQAPRAIAQASNGLIWVSNKESGSISIINPNTFTVQRTLALPRGSQPFGIVTSSAGYALVVLEGTAQLRKINTTSFATLGLLKLSSSPRHLSLAADGSTAYVSRFISPPALNEHTAQPGMGRGQITVVNSTAMSLMHTINLAASTLPDAETQGRGLPNYLGAAVISPDGTQAFVPSKQDNIYRGTQRDGQALNFQNTVRAASSRLDLLNQTEEPTQRIDHDNASVASAAAFDARGVLLFVALETSREVAILEAHARREILRINVGRAPQGLLVSPDGNTLFVSNFMDRSVSIFDLSGLQARGQLEVPLLDTVSAVGTEALGSTVLKGKQFFYDARDTRLARDHYMSCASCHNDGGHDGRVWDLSHAGEGLRNTISLRGRAGAQGHLHWSNSFDEVQDFEGQIRSLAGGTGLMSNDDFLAGTRSLSLGDKKAGVSSDLDALAAYVKSLNQFAPSPTRPSATILSATAATGKVVFQNLGCASCHAGTAFTYSSINNPINIGTIKPTSGQRAGSTLTGIDVPTLRDVWQTAPYLHDGSATTLGAAVRAHKGVVISNADLNKLVVYLQEIGGDEVSASVLIK